MVEPACRFAAGDCVLVYFLDCRVREIPDYVTYQLERFAEAGLRIVVATFLSAPGIQRELAALKQSGTIAEFAVSDKFNSAFAAFASLVGTGETLADVGVRDLFFANAQIFGPFVPMQELLAARAAAGTGVWGITTITGREGEFVEPYFLAVGGRVLADPRFGQMVVRLGASAVPPRARMNALSAELGRTFGFAAFVRVQDARPIRVFRFEQPFSVNATDFLIRKYRMPFIPVAAFRNRREDRFPITAALIAALRQTFPAYPEGMIRDYLAVHAPLSWLKDYPGTLRVLGLPGASGEPPAMRVAVKAHLFYPEMLEVAYACFANIPVPFDLLCTTCTDEVRDALQREAVAHVPNMRTVKVVKVPNRGRDLGPWLTALTDEEDAYDVILKYQTKRRLQQPNVFGEAWSEFVNDSVLGSPGMVGEILRLFADNPKLGIAFPAYPTPITITTPSAYYGCAEMEEMFEVWRQRCCPEAPAETAAPIFSAGTVFWYRPAALRRLRRLGVALEDLPPEPLPPLTVLHALERIIPYVSQAEGFCYNTLVTYGRLLRGYELMEDRLLSTVLFDRSAQDPVSRVDFSEWGFVGLAKATVHAFGRALKKRIRWK